MPNLTFVVTPERALARCSLDEALRATDGRSFWIDVDGRERSSLRSTLESVGAHPLAIEAVLDPTPASLVAAYGKSLFLAFPIRPSWDTEERAFLWVVCVPGTMVTVHDTDVSALAHIMARYGDAMRLHADGTSAVLYQILDFLIDEDMAFTLKTRDLVDRLDEHLDEGSMEAVADGTVALKRQLARLSGTFEDQLYCVSYLQAIESEAFSASGLEDYLRDAFLHLEHVSRTVGRQLTHLSAIQQQYQLRLQDETSNRLRLLTVVSAVFLPLSLIAGIYGMNFRNMPELEWRYGYVAVLGLMLAVAVTLLWQLYRRGWFD